VYAKGPGSKTSSYSLIDLAFKSRNRNKQYHDGVGSPYGQHFQDGGAIAVGGVGGSLAIIGAASYAGIAGINWWIGMSRIQQLRKMAMGRKVLRNFNFGAGAGDLSTQLATNGGDWSKVNWTSVAGQTLVKGKFAFVANSASAFVTIKGENENIVDVNFGTSNFIEFGTNLWANGLSQLGGNL